VFPREDGTMKRLVVCCDGTWKAASSSTVSNIVKIAQTIPYQVPDVETEPVQQWVTYVSGPGTGGFLADRLIGGAFGLGLEANLSSAYWHLASNWEPGDQIYIFGFSRGAYTARSLVGLISRVGILTPEAMIAGRFPEALRLYKQRPPRDGVPPQSWQRFREQNCYPEQATVDFLGVFDTVGALGVPGLTAFRHGFHDVHLTPNVQCARQALAMDERRRNFEPCLWEVPVEPGCEYRPDFCRVKQVWFEGSHSDVGGGYPECGLSDNALRWMIDEAESTGLVFDRDRLQRLEQECPSGPEHMRRHDSLGIGYRFLNVIRAVRNPRSERFYWDSWRRLAADEDRGVRLSSRARGRTDEAANLRRWREELGGPLPETLIEPIGDEIFGTEVGQTTPAA